LFVSEINTDDTTAASYTDTNTQHSVYGAAIRGKVGVYGKQFK